jgi:hypothetical protein
MYSYLCEVAKCPKTAPKSTFWAANHPKKSPKEEGEGGEEVNGESGHSLLPSGRCKIVGGDWVKPGHVLTGKGKGGKDLCQGSSWPGRKRGQKSARRLAYSCEGKDRNLEKTCTAGGWGGRWVTCQTSPAG